MPGFWELIIIAAVGLIFLGPEKLYQFAKKAGAIFGELQKISKGFQSALDEEFSEPFPDIEAQIESTQSRLNNLKEQQLSESKEENIAKDSVEN